MSRRRLSREGTAPRNTIPPQCSLLSQWSRPQSECRRVCTMDRRDCIGEGMSQSEDCIHWSSDCVRNICRGHDNMRRRSLCPKFSILRDGHCRRIPFRIYPYRCTNVVRSNCHRHATPIARGGTTFVVLVRFLRRVFHDLFFFSRLFEKWIWMRNTKCSM